METRLTNSLGILITLIILSGCNRQGYVTDSNVEVVALTPAALTVPNQSTSAGIVTSQINATEAESGSRYTTPDPNPSLALVTLKGQTIHFECLNRKNCIPDVVLEGHIFIGFPYHLGQVFYWNPESVFITLYSNSAIPEKMDILHINPKAGEIKSIKSPDESENTIINFAAGRLILARYNGRNVFIVDSNLSIAKVEVGIDIYKLIVEGDKVIALNQIPIEKDGQIYIDISIVNILSKQAKSERLLLPGLEISHDQQTPESDEKYLRFVEGVSGDLENLYCIYVDGNEPGTVKLGTFDVKGIKKPISTSGGVAAVGYSQYHGMLYASYSDKNDGGPGASLYDMSTGRSLIEYSKNPKWIGKKLMVVPFGDYFLLGTNDRVIVLGSDGEIIKMYPLPKEWIDQPYQLMSVRN